MTVLPEELLVESQIDSRREQLGLACQEYWITAYHINLGSCRKRTRKIRVRMVLVGTIAVTENLT